MAFDKTGKYHMNPHHAAMADKGKAPDKSTQQSTKSTEPQPGPDGVSDTGKDLAAGIPMPSAKMPMSAPSKGSAPSGDDGMNDMGEPKHPAHEAADMMAQHAATMDPQELSELRDKLQSVLQEITDLLGGSTQQSSGAPMAMSGY